MPCRRGANGNRICVCRPHVVFIVFRRRCDIFATRLPFQIDCALRPIAGINHYFVCRPRACVERHLAGQVIVRRVNVVIRRDKRQGIDGGAGVDGQLRIKRIVLVFSGNTRCVKCVVAIFWRGKRHPHRRAARLSHNGMNRLPAFLGRRGVVHSNFTRNHCKACSRTQLRVAA